MKEARLSPKTLQRSRQERMLFGVAGGLAQYFAVDPILVRLAFVLVTLATGFGLLFYIVLAVLMPERPLGEPEVTPAPVISFPRGRGREVLAYLLVGLGALVLAGNLGLLRIFSWEYFWPLVLVGFGALLLIRRNRE